MKKYIVALAKDERETLGALTSKGKHKSQKILNALILLGCDEGEYQKKRSTNEEMARILQDLGDLKGAKEHYERALTIFQKSLGENHPSTATVRNNLELLANV